MHTTRVVIASGGTTRCRTPQSARNIRSYSSIRIRETILITSRRANAVPYGSQAQLAGHRRIHSGRLGRLLVDEAVQDIDFDQPCDLVGLSIMTCYAPRAYEIATEFRKRGKTVVLGGVHPTYCPEEALRFCDAIVCGEAEDLWPQVVADFLAGSMKRMYKMEQFPALDHYKSPRVELLSPDAYMTRQCSFTTRGCHFDCEFCSVSPFNGKTTRRRPVPEVMKELTQVKRWICGELVERMRTIRCGKHS